MKTWRKCTSTLNTFFLRHASNLSIFASGNFGTSWFSSSSCRSLRRTTAEIQNYGFERLERATTSKDSGISNMADVEERMEGLALSNSVSYPIRWWNTKYGYFQVIVWSLQGRSSSVSSPTQRGRSVGNITVNGSDTIAGDLILPQENNGYKTHGTRWAFHLFLTCIFKYAFWQCLEISLAGSSPDSANRQQIVDDMVKTLQSKVAQTAEKVSVLQEFQLYVRESDASHIKQNFKYVHPSCYSIESLLVDLSNLSVSRSVSGKCWEFYWTVCPMMAKWYK